MIAAAACVSILLASWKHHSDVLKRLLELTLSRHIAGEPLATTTLCITTDKTSISTGLSRDCNGTVITTYYRYDTGRWRLPECLCLVSRRPFFGMFNSVLAAGQALRLLQQAAPTGVVTVPLTFPLLSITVFVAGV